MPAPRPAAMRRALLAAAAALPLAAWPAQSPARIAWISPINAASSADYLAAFRQRMRENGLVEGRHYRLDIHYADGHYDRFPALLGVALAGAPSVIVVITVASVIAAQRATQTVPIVFVSTNDPLGSGLVTSLSRPDGNTTGISNQNEDLIRSPWSRSQSRDPARNAKSSHRRRAPDLLVEHAANQRTGRQEDRPSAVTGSGRKVASLIPPRDLASALLQAGVAAVFDQRGYVDAGGLMSYRLDWDDQTQRTAAQLDKVLRGVPPAQLPFELPTRSALVLNAGTAKALGLKIPIALRMRADEVIQ